jgi:2-C-methyl-D-erythritol 4-phosphate cytidylyltransferase
MSVGVVVPAAGSGRRLGGVTKPFLVVAGSPMLLHALRPFLDEPRVSAIVIPLPHAEARDPPPWLRDLDPRVHVVAGGEERGDSVLAGLEALPDSTEIVLIHDAARPLVTRELVARAIAAAEQGRSAVIGVPVTDTIQEVDRNGRILATPERERLWQAQTPQAFPRDVIMTAYRRAAQERVSATDDAALVRRYGGTVVMIEGDRENLKLTSAADLVLIEALLRARSS